MQPIRKLILITFIAWPLCGAITLVNHVPIRGVSANGGTSAAIGTTGANFLALYVNSEIATPTVSDSKGNTWTALTDISWASLHGKWFYAFNATTGTSHTFTIGPAGCVCSGYVLAFSGMLTSAPTIVQASFSAAASTTITASVTSTVNNSLIVAGISNDTAGVESIDSGYAITDQFPFNAGNADGGGAAWLVKSPAGATGPTWTSTISARLSTEIVCFTQSAGGSSPARHRVINQ